MSQSRVLISGVDPCIDGGIYYAKTTVGATFTVAADLVADGHDKLAGCLCIKHQSAKRWTEIPLSADSNDRWMASTIIEKAGFYTYTLEAWIDHLQTWQDGLRKKADAGQHVQVELQDGLPLLERLAAKAYGNDKKVVTNLLSKIKEPQLYKEAVSLGCSESLEHVIAKYPLKDFATRYTRELTLWADRPKAAFSAWYELFPRSTSPDPKRSGTLADVAQQLPRIAAMGFDVLYMPPIHPIGEVNRKGKNNSVSAKAG